MAGSLKPHFMMLAPPLPTLWMTWSTYLLLGVAIVLCLFTWISPRLRLRQSGREAPAVAYWAPFGIQLVETILNKANLWCISGIDLFATAINRIYHNDFFAWTRQILDCPGRTVSLNMLGVKVLMTDQPENTKTILSTKVSVSGSSQKWCLQFASVFGLWKGGRFPQDLA